jgi:two-component system sensor histidine kinase BaeS
VRRRLVVTMLLIVTVALGVAGVGSQVLVRRATLEDARRDVALQARQLAGASEDLRRPAALAVLRQALRLRGADLVRFNANGRSLTAIPAGISAADLRPKDLAAGATVSGTRGTLVYGASPVTFRSAREGVVAVVFTRQLRSLNRGIAFFALAALVSLVLAAVIGARAGRRIARPLELAEQATRRMAAGDLTTRIDVPGNADPEIGSLVASITSLAASLQRSQAAEREFFLSVSHELRTPLTALRGYGEALADDAMEDTVRAGNVISTEARRLERLVGDLLQLGRLGAGSFDLNPEPVRVDDVLNGAVDALDLAAREAGVQLRPPESAEVVVTADPDRLAQVVANLIENALSHAQSTVSLGVVPAGFFVDDDGPGIAPDEREAVFARHYRSDRTPSRHIGTGVGLAIVAELVAAMGGSVTVASPVPDASVGTRFTVTLPPPATP